MRLPNPQEDNQQDLFRQRHAKFHYKAIKKPGELAKAHGISLRQSYLCVVKETMKMIQWDCRVK